jgi:hypothetical protein
MIKTHALNSKQSWSNQEWQHDLYLEEGSFSYLLYSEQPGKLEKRPLLPKTPMKEQSANF